MSRAILGLLVVAAMMGSLSARAQLASTDHGAAAVDSNGLMWANTVGTNLSWSPTGEMGSAQAWITNLNAVNYGGFNDWTLATGNGAVGANTLTNQLGQLFNSDCGNVVGTSTVLNNAGKNCTALSAVNTVIGTPSIFFSASGDPALSNPFETFFWTYQTPNSSQVPWTNDSQFGTGMGLPIVGLGDALAVRAAPEIDPSSAASGLALLLGTLAVLRGRRTAKPSGAVT